MIACGTDVAQHKQAQDDLQFSLLLARISISLLTVGMWFD